MTEPGMGGDARLDDAITASLDALARDAASESLARNVYWPKWDSPWWHITLLFEMGLVRHVPAKAIRSLVEGVRAQSLTWFPFKIEDVPPGVDPLMGIPCHCQLGTMYQFLTAWGLDVDSELPWVRPWFLRYQMPDGGLNCDEAAYLKETPRSSIVSTLPPLEAILHCTPRPLTVAEQAFLDRGAGYLLRHRLFRSERQPERIIDESWTRLCFPRFYEYDYLRGLAFLRAWSRTRGQPLPAEAVGEAETLLHSQRDPVSGSPLIGRSWHAQANTRALDPQGAWTLKQPSSTFPLLDLVRQPGRPAPWLSPAFPPPTAGPAAH